MVTLRAMSRKMRIANLRHLGHGTGFPLRGAPGPLNATTDVKGLEVGYTAVISADAASPLGRDSTSQQRCLPPFATSPNYSCFRRATGLLIRHGHRFAVDSCVVRRVIRRKLDPDLAIARIHVVGQRAGHGKRQDLPGANPARPPWCPRSHVPQSC